MESELETYYREVASSPSAWAHACEDECGCGGRGWFLSEVDTLHQCPIHYDGQPTNDDPEEAWEAYYVRGERVGQAVAEPVVLAVETDWADDDIPF